MPGDELLERGEAALSARRLIEARSCFDKADQLHADAARCCAGRWMAAMLAGDFHAAWAENDTIRRLGLADPNRFWNGEEITGKRLIVRCLHGLGDAVQMLRYAPLLAAEAQSVVYEMPPKLLPFAPCFAGVNHAITWGAGAPQTPPEWDVQVEVMELPYLFRTCIPDLPVATEYLRAPAVLSVAPGVHTSSRPKVGLVWSSGDWDPDRSMPYDHLQTLISEASVHWWSLQGGTAAMLADRLGLRALPEDGLVSLAVAMAEMDLVITVDTLAAHMAGAMGRPAWVMLQWGADWRWMVDRTDSPWYPTMRLFRQPSPRDWAGVTKAVQQALVDWT